MSAGRRQSVDPPPAPAWRFEAFGEHLEWERNLSTATLRAYRREIRRAVTFFTDELEIGFFLKRARVAMQIFGDTGFHKNRYATLCGY